MSNRRPTQRDASPEATATALWRASLRWRRTVQRALQPLELSLPEYLVLASLVRLTAGAGGARFQRELSDDSGVDPMTTSRVVRALDARGLLSRGLQYGDTRRWGVLPTRRGRDLAKRATVHFQTASAAFVAPLGARLGQLRGLLSMLGRQN